jgi:hypothetical protein
MIGLRIVPDGKLFLANRQAHGFNTVYTLKPPSASADRTHAKWRRRGRRAQ